MNPLRVFNNIYFGASLIYDRVFGYRESCWFAGILILSLIQWTNMIVILGFFNVELSLPSKKFPVLFFALMLIPITINFIRYRKDYKYNEMQYHWDSSSKMKKNVTATISTLYAFISIVLVGI